MVHLNVVNLLQMRGVLNANVFSQRRRCNDDVIFFSEKKMTSLLFRLLWEKKSHLEPPWNLQAIWQVLRVNLIIVDSIFFHWSCRLHPSSFLARPQRLIRTLAVKNVWRWATGPTSAKGRGNMCTGIPGLKSWREPCKRLRRRVLLGMLFDMLNFESFRP